MNYTTYNVNLKELIDNFDLDQFLLEHKRIETKNPFRSYPKETAIIFGTPVELHTFYKRKDSYLFITDIHTDYKGNAMVDGYVLTDQQHRHYVLTELLEGDNDNV